MKRHNWMLVLSPSSWHKKKMHQKYSFSKYFHFIEEKQNKTKQTTKAQRILLGTQDHVWWRDKSSVSTRLRNSTLLYPCRLGCVPMCISTLDCALPLNSKRPAAAPTVSAMTPRARLSHSWCPGPMMFSWRAKGSPCVRASNQVGNSPTHSRLAWSLITFCKRKKNLSFFRKLLLVFTFNLELQSKE